MVSCFIINILKYLVKYFSILFCILRYTSKSSSVYAILLKWPSSGSLIVEAPVKSKFQDIKLLGCDQKLNWTQKDKIIIDLNLSVACLTNTKWNWVFEFINLSWNSKGFFFVAIIIHWIYELYENFKSKNLKIELKLKFLKKF